jgi:hypothetical protein
MNNGQKSLSINETFIIESENDGTMSACTGFFTNALVSCTGNTQIILGTNIIETNSAFSATTFYGDGSNLTGISTQDTFVTGGTYDQNYGVATFTNNTGGTFNVTGFYTGATDIYVTAVTFTNNLLTLYRNDGVTFAATIDNFISLNVNGPVSATTFYGDGSNLSGISTQDTFVTGGTYSDGNAIFTNNTGGTFNVTGFYTGATDVFVTGATKSNDVATFVNNTGGTFTLTGLTDTIFSGGTVANPTYFINGLTATTISATTYLNLPTDVRVTGGTYFDGVTTFTNNTGGMFTIDGPSNYDAGVILGAENWVDNGDGSIDLPEIKVALYDNPNNLELLKIYTVASGTTGVGGIPALVNDDTNYIIVEYNGGSPRYNVLDNDGTVTSSDVVLYMIVYRANNFVHTLEFGDMGAGLTNKLNTRLISTDRFARESGCALGLSGSTGIVTLSSGVVWNGSYRQIVTGVNSQDDIFFKSFHSGGTWVYATTGNTINNDYYDDGTDLISATAGKYLVNWYFRGQEVNDHLYELISFGEYDTIQLAEASPEPNLPELITSHAFLVGRIIVGVSATTGITQSAFNTVFQPSGAPVLHNDLAGIQGGLAGQYYHLDSNKYNNLALTNTDNNFSVLQSFNAGLISTTISATTLTVTGNPTNLQYVIINNDLDLFNSQVETNNYGTYGRLRLFRASGSQASPTTPSSGSAVGRLEFGAWNSATSTFIANAKVEASMDATSGGNDLPSRLTFFTTPDGSTTMTERMRINSAGNMRIGGVAMSLSDVINVEGGSVAFQNGYGLRFQSTGGTMYAGVYSNDNDTVIKSLGNAIRFKNRSGSSNLMSILDNGFVGVNNDTPTEYLHVNGNTLINGGFTAGTISATTYQNLPISGFVSGTGTTGTYPVFTSGTTIGDSRLVDGVNGGVYTFGTQWINLINGGSVLTLNRAQSSMNFGLGVQNSFATEISSTQPQEGLHITSVGDFVLKAGNPLAVVYNVNRANRNIHIGASGDTDYATQKLQVTGGLRVTDGLTATTISATTYQNLPFSGTVVGSGTTGFIPKFNTGNTIDSSVIFQSGSNIGVNTTTTTYRLNVNSGNNWSGMGVGDFGLNRIMTLGYQNAANLFSPTSAGTSYWIRTTATGPIILNSNTGIVGDLIVSNSMSATTYLGLPIDIRVTGATYSNNTFTYTNNTGGTFNTLFNTVTGLTINGNLTVTGNTSLRSFTGTSGTISGSGQNILTVVGSGNSTTAPLFSVQGSNGELFSVTDSLTGSLFSVNDISGLPIIEVFSDNTMLMGSYLAPSLNTTVRLSLTAGTNTIYSLPISAYTGAFVDYTLINTGSTSARAGNIMSIWTTGATEFTEVSTNDIGSTTGVTFSTSLSGSNALIRASATTSGWVVKTIIRSI